MAIAKVIVNGVTKIDLTSDTAHPTRMVFGTRAHANNGSEITGQIPPISSLSVSGLTVTAPYGYYSENTSATCSDANLVAGNIKKDVSIFGVTGTFEGGGGSTTVSFSGSDNAVFSGTYITYIDGNGEYQHTTALKGAVEGTISYQMMSGSLLTYVADFDPELGGLISASFTGMTLVDTKTVSAARITLYLRFYQVD